MKSYKGYDVTGNAMTFRNERGHRMLLPQRADFAGVKEDVNSKVRHDLKLGSDWDERRKAARVMA